MLNRGEINVPMHTLDVFLNSVFGKPIHPNYCLAFFQPKAMQMNVYNASTSGAGCQADAGSLTYHRWHTTGALYRDLMSCFNHSDLYHYMYRL